MEEATISDDNKKGSEQNSGFFNDNRFPNIVDTDDLVWELGKDKVKELNYTKILDSLYKKLKETQDELSVLTLNYNQIAPNLESLKKTKNDLIETNKKLDKVLVEERNKKNQFSKENEINKSKNKELSDGLKVLEDKLKIKKEENEDLKKTVNSLNEKCAFLEERCSELYKMKDKRTARKK